ncbi:uncharacterized protein LOC106155606 [Lingula anatina]|uniref:Uncharacterized protein LOC106155606 n=1 Tax=Lingula anatina TaxID=7574 RepID=A0A1S3HIL8_LINAN|nr:uncharacterized protein LOC106155606 [Lingula anatina]|eukprot:XP_013385960.1 uncharacterized protein LOC106155606 [Lingula anatina]
MQLTSCIVICILGLLLIDVCWCRAAGSSSPRTDHAVDISLEELQRQFAHDAVHIRENGCQCLASRCGCCAEIVFPPLAIDSTACLNFTWDEVTDELNVVFAVDKSVLLNETISAVNPPPLCAGLPGVATWCTIFYNMSYEPGHLGGCLRYELRFLTQTLLRVPAGCFYFPGNHLHPQIIQRYMRPVQRVDPLRSHTKEGGRNYFLMHQVRQQPGSVFRGVMREFDNSIERSGYHVLTSDNGNERSGYHTLRTEDVMTKSSNGTGCSCSGNKCGCCVQAVFKPLQVNDTVCANFTLDTKNDTLNVVVTINDNVLLNETVDAHNPPPLCQGMPGIGTWCTIFYNMTYNPFGGCMKFEVRILGKTVLTIPAGCFHFPGKLHRPHRKLEELDHLAHFLKKQSISRGPSHLESQMEKGEIFVPHK